MPQIFPLMIMLFLVQLLSINSQSISYCNFFGPPTSKSLSTQCSNFSTFISVDFSSHPQSSFLTTQPQILCLSKLHDSFLLLDTSANLLKTLTPDKTRTFSSSDSCIQVGVSQIVVCSNGADLLTWNVSSGLFVSVFTGGSASIVNFDSVSSMFANLVVARDSSFNIKIIDINLATQKFSIPGENYILIKDDLIGFQMGNKAFQIIYNLTTFTKLYNATMDLERAFYFESGNLKGIIGSMNNKIFLWNFYQDKSYNEITTFTYNVTNLYVVNNSYLVIIGADTSIFMYDPSTNRKTVIESVSNSPQIFHFNQNVILIKSYTSYFFDASSKQKLKNLPISNSFNFYFTNITTFTIQSDLSLDQWAYSSCDTKGLIQSTEFQTNFAFDMREDSTRVGAINKNNQIIILNLLTNQFFEYSFSGLSNSICTNIIRIPYSTSDDMFVLSCYQGSNFNIYLANLNSNELTKVPIGDFNCSLNSLLYMEMEDYVAFECGGQISIYSIFHYTLISQWSHAQTNFLGLFSLKKSPNNIGSFSSQQIKVWDVFSGILQKYVSTDNYTIQNCVSFNTSTDSFACSLKNTQTQTSSIKIWNTIALSIITELKDPVYSSSTDFQYQQLKFVQLDQNYLLTSSNQKIDLWELNTYTISKTISISRYSSTLIHPLSSETLIFDYSKSSFMVWDFSQSTHENISCVGNYYYDLTSKTCIKCGSACQNNQFCTRSTPNVSITPTCGYFFSDSYSSYQNCLSKNQFSSYTSSNSFCVNDTNITDLHYSEICYACFDGYFYSGSSCVQCHKECSTCFGLDSFNCLTCSDSKFELGDIYTCVRKLDMSRIILIIVLSIFGGILIVILWIYLCWLHKKITKSFHEITSPSTSKLQNLKVKTHEENEPMFFAGSNHDEFLSVLAKNSEELLQNLKTCPSGTRQKTFTSFLWHLHNSIGKHCYILKNSEMNCLDSNDCVEKDLISVGGNGAVYVIENTHLDEKHRFIWKAMINGESDGYSEEKIKAFLESTKASIELKNVSVGICRIVGVGISHEKMGGLCGLVQDYYEFNLNNFVMKYAENVAFKVQLVKSLLKVLKDLHFMGFHHGNLKSFNVLVNYSEMETNSFQIGLSDARKYRKLNQLINNILSSDKKKLRFVYIPPERFLNNDEFEFNENADIWSLGIMIFEIFYGDTDLYQMTIPWSDEDPENINIENVREIILKGRNKKNEFCAKSSSILPEITEAINSCLQINAENRINVANLLGKFNRIEMLIP